MVDLTVVNAGSDQALAWEVRDGLTVLARLTGEQLEPTLWRLKSWEVLVETGRQQAERRIVETLQQLGTAEKPEVLSNDQPARAAVNGLLEQAGWRVQRRKVLVQRELSGLLPRWPLPPDVQFRSLAQVGQPEFLRVMLLAATGDPFETSTPESAAGDFAALVEHAGSAFNPNQWLTAWLEDEPLGVLLPQAYPDELQTGTLFYLGACPAFRGRGVGRALQAEGLQRLAAAGVTSYRGSTDTRNAGMRRIFQVNGCLEVRQQWFYQWSPEESA